MTSLWFSQHIPMLFPIHNYEWYICAFLHAGRTNPYNVRKERSSYLIVNEVFCEVA